MNSYNNIEKIEYSNNSDENVLLKQYILFTDDVKQEKYILFKFQNILNQPLHEISFEISQFDEFNNLIEKSIISYKDFYTTPKSEFVPNAKYKINYLCKTIKYTLILAVYNKVKWENGTYIEIPYAFEKHVKTIKEKQREKKLKKLTKIEKKELKINNKKAKKAEKRQKKEDKFQRKLQKQKFSKELTKKNYAVRNIYNQNKVAFPTFLSVLLMVVILAFMGITSFLYTGNGRGFSVGDFDYLYKNANEVYIYGYDGAEKDIVIQEEYINEAKIVGIYNNAFANKNIESITFQNDYVVGKSAFKNCKNLKDINGTFTYIDEGAFENCTSLEFVDEEHLTRIQKNAFKNCSSLKYVYALNAVVEKNAFLGAVNLEALKIKNAPVDSLKSLFDTKVENLKNYNLKTLEIVEKDRVEKNYFEGFNSLEEYTINSQDPNACEWQYGSYNGLSFNSYVLADFGEVINGSIKTINPECKTMTIDSNPAFNNLSLTQNLDTVEKLIIDNTKFSLSKYFMNFLPNVHAIELKSVNAIDEAALSGNYIQQMEVTADVFNKLNLSSILRNTSLEKLTVLKGNNTILTGSLINVSNLREVVIEEGITSLPNNFLVSCPEVQLISLPTTFVVQGSVIGFGCDSLNNVRFTAGAALKNYEMFNQSAFATKYLVMSGETLDVSNTFFEACENLTTLQASNTFSGEVLGLFANSTNLCNLQIKLDASVKIGDTLSYVLNGDIMNDNISLFMTHPNVRNVDIQYAGAIGERYFGDCQLLETVVLRKVTGVIKSIIFENCMNLKYVYLPNGTYTNSDVIPSLLELGSKVILEGKREALYTGNINVIENINAETNSYTFKLVQDEIEYTYTYKALIIATFNPFMVLDVKDSNGNKFDVIAVNTYYSMRVNDVEISSPYFNSKATIKMAF